MVEVGIGYYTPTEAGRLIDLSAQKIRRWIGGYSYCYRDRQRQAKPLWTAQAIVDGHLELGFRDLIELRFIKAFTDEGISIQTLRKCLPLARELFQDQRPLSTARFRTDGRTVFVEIYKQDREPELLDLVKKQYVFHDIVAPAFSDLEFDGQVPTRWWPVHDRKIIVVDPRRSFGQPILAASGIPTATLASEVEVEGSVERVAQLFRVPPEEVSEAVAFERTLAA